MKNFPFLEEDLLSIDLFISYCSDRDIKIDRDFLELLHAKGLIYPCVRLDPGINLFRKIKRTDNPEEVFVFEKDLDKFNIAHLYPEIYYSSSGVSYGRPDWLGFYRENKMIEYPVEDKKFIPWNKFKFAVADFQQDASYYDDHRSLFYSKRQIYAIKHILDWRVYKMNFNIPPNETIFSKLKEDISKWLQTFDKNFIENQYADYLSFFEFLKELEILKKQAAERAYQVLKKDKPDFNLDSEENFDDYKGEYQSEKSRLFRELSQKIDCNWLGEWREKILNFGMPSHQDLNLYKFIEDKKNLSNFQTKGRIRFMLDSIDIARKIEKFFTVVGFDKFLTIEKFYWGADNFKYCDICGKSFVPNEFVGNRAKVCEEKECRKKYNNKLKREGRKLGKYKG